MISFHSALSYGIQPLTGPITLRSTEGQQMLGSNTRAHNPKVAMEVGAKSTGPAWGTEAAIHAVVLAELRALGVGAGIHTG